MEEVHSKAAKHSTQKVWRSTPLSQMGKELSVEDLKIKQHQEFKGDFPGGRVVKNLSANAGDTGLIPAPSRAHEPQLRKPAGPRACAPQQEKPVYCD